MYAVPCGKAAVFSLSPASAKQAGNDDERSGYDASQYNEPDDR
jgi:hypothetical protein